MSMSIFARVSPSEEEYDNHGGRNNESTHRWCTNAWVHGPERSVYSRYSSLFFNHSSELWSYMRAKAKKTGAYRLKNHDTILSRLHPNYTVNGVKKGLFHEKRIDTNIPCKGIDEKLFYECINCVVHLKYECAGRVLQSISDGFMDELCVMSKGDTFDTTERLGVRAIDLDEKKSFFSQKHQRQKYQTMSFHTHPLVIKDKLGAHAPPSYEDGSCFLSTLKNSMYHAIFGYSGIYLLRKLKGKEWKPCECDIAVSRFVDGLDIKNKEKVKGEIRKLQEMQNMNTFQKELNFIRTMNFDTLSNIREYLLAYMYLFRMHLAVEFYPYSFHDNRFKNILSIK